jgi:tRNA pseudouridine38-40 synthase
VASGRTDAGVHAIGQVVSFACDTHRTVDVLRRALDANLPKDIVVLDVRDAPEGFHAIRDTVRKRYRYVIQDGSLPDVFARTYAWYIPHRLDAGAMSQAGQRLAGRYDFSSFEASGSQRTSSVRTIFDLSVQRRSGDHLDRIFIEIEADGFLYNMVRNIVGTLVEVGRGKQTPDWVSAVLEARDRKLAGMTAPPLGLFLLRVWCQDERVPACSPNHASD